MTTVSDDFDDTNGTASTAHVLSGGSSAWSKHANFTGVNEIQSNQMTNQFGSNGVDYCGSDSPSSADQDILVTQNSVDNSGGPVGRMNASVSTFYMVQYVAGAPEWRLQKIVTGTLTTLGTYAGDAPSTSRNNKLEIRDANKKLFIGGVERISTTDNVITAAGEWGYFMGDTSDNLDNWSASNPAAGGLAIPIAAYHYNHNVGSKL